MSEIKVNDIYIYIYIYIHVILFIGKTMLGTSEIEYSLLYIEIY